MWGEKEKEGGGELNMSNTRRTGHPPEHEPKDKTNKATYYLNLSPPNWLSPTIPIEGPIPIPCVEIEVPEHTLKLGRMSAILKFPDLQEIELDDATSENHCC